jgi:hypothetical protein
MSVQDNPQEFSEIEEIENAAKKLDDIKYYLNKWNGMTSETVKFGRNPLRTLIGWKESKEKGNEELFGRKFVETVVALSKIAYPDTEPKQEEPAEEPNNVIPITTTKPPLPTPDQLFHLIYTGWGFGKVPAREVCSIIIDLALRGGWNWRDPRGRMETSPDRALSFFRGFCEPQKLREDQTERELYIHHLNDNQKRLFDFVCESFSKWYEIAYPDMVKNNK